MIQTAPPREGPASDLNPRFHISGATTEGARAAAEGLIHRSNCFPRPSQNKRHINLTPHGNCAGRRICLPTRWSSALNFVILGSSSLQVEEMGLRPRSDRELTTADWWTPIFSDAGGALALQLQNEISELNFKIDSKCRSFWEHLANTESCPPPECRVNKPVTPGERARTHGLIHRSNCFPWPSQK